MSKATEAVSTSPLLSYLGKTYPFLNELSDYFLSFGLINSVVLFISSLVLQLKSFNKEYLPWVNKFTDYVETLVVDYLFVKFIDHFIPSLKSLHLSHLKVANLYQSAISYSNIDSLKKTKIYTKSVETASSTLKVINSKLLLLIENKTSVELTTGGEYQKLVKILTVLFSQLKSYPFKVQNHVSQVYNDEFSKNNNSIKAIAKTSNELATEITTKFSNGFKKNSQIAKETGSDAISSAINGLNGNGISSVEVTPSNINGEISVGA